MADEPRPLRVLREAAMADAQEVALTLAEAGWDVEVVIDKIAEGSYRVSVVMRLPKVQVMAVVPVPRDFDWTDTNGT